MQILIGEHGSRLANKRYKSTIFLPLLQLCDIIIMLKKAQAVYTACA